MASLKELEKFIDDANYYGDPDPCPPHRYRLLLSDAVSGWKRTQQELDELKERMSDLRTLAVYDGDHRETVSVDVVMFDQLTGGEGYGKSDS